MREIAGTFLAVSVITWGVTHANTPVLSEYGHLILAVTFLGSALTLARREPNGAQRFGIDLCGVLDARDDEAPGFQGILDTLRRAVPRLGSELLFALLVAGLVFPVFALGFRFWHAPVHPFSFHLPREPLDFVLSQLLVVALPEEALFRGYVQTRTEELFSARVTLFGRPSCVQAILLQAALFAVLHFIVAFQPARLAVFFPALLFGVMRSLRGGIGAAIWFHAFCNLLSEILTRGYL